MHTSESSLDQSTSLGALLRAEREKRGLSLGEVAERLKLSLKQLTAIENDDWHSLPGTTFARGFVRSYARYLELDEQQMLKLLDASLPTSAPAASVGDTAKPHVAAVEASDQAPVASSSSSRASLWVIGLVMVAVGGYSLYSKQADKPAAAVLASAPLAQQPASGAVAEEQAAPAPISAEASVAVSAAPVAMPVPVPVAPATAAASTPAAAVAAANVAIEIRASAESWVEVRDRDGKKLIFGLVPANGSQSASGAGPLKIKIGNAQAVQLTHNGQPVDLTGKIRGSTAKLELN